MQRCKRYTPVFSYFLQQDIKLFATLFIISFWFKINTAATGQLEHRLLTSLAGVVHEHDLHEQVSGGAVNDAVDGAQQGAPGLIVKDNHNAGAGHVIGIHLGFTAEEAEGREIWSVKSENGTLTASVWDVNTEVTLNKEQDPAG